MLLKLKICPEIVYEGLNLKGKKIKNFYNVWHFTYIITVPKAFLISEEPQA
jgi:hypothetical protein